MTKPLITTEPTSPFAAMMAKVSIGTGVLFVVLLLLLHVLEPEYDPTWRFISEYQLGQFGWIMQLAFLALAVSLGAMAVVLWKQVRTWPGYIGLFVLCLAALGLLLAGVFTTDPETTSRGGAATFHGTMHIIGGSLDYTPIGLLLLSFSLGRTERWRPVRKWLYITAVITLIMMALFMLNLPFDGKINPGVHAGLFGRFLLVSYLGWLLVAGFHALKLRG